MYLYQPCLLILALYAWAFEPVEREGRRLRALFPLALLAVSELELTFARIMIYPAALLLPVLFLLKRDRTVAWAEVLTASLLGGFLCWKAADSWPLFPGLTFLCGILLLAATVLLCRQRGDRLLACAIGGLFFELFFCLREYTLFSFCVIRMGSRDGLSLAASTHCLYAVLEQLCHALPKRKRAVSIVN